MSDPAAFPTCREVQHLNDTTLDSWPQRGVVRRELSSHEHTNMTENSTLNFLSSNV